MRRRLFTLLSAVSLLLGLAVAGLWARSYHRSDSVLWGRALGPNAPERTIQLYSGRGGLMVSSVEATWLYGRVPSMPDDRHFVHRSEDDPEPPEYVQPGAAFDYRHQAWGFGADRFTSHLFLDLGTDHVLNSGAFYGPSTLSSSSTISRVYFPHWFVVAPASVLPALWLRRCRRERRGRVRAASGLCRGCGYDLRASPGRCPECGAAGGLL
jgi:hypothetical protein